MILRQFLHTAPVGISYLFGCGGKAAGAVVDPVGDIQVYVRAAEETGMRIRLVVDTHIHADHPSAARRLAEAGCSTKEIAAITGHRTLQEIERYTQAADQKRLAVSAIRRLQGQKLNKNSQTGSKFGKS